LYPFDRNKALSNAATSKTGGQGFAFESDEFEPGVLSFAGLNIVLQFLKRQADTKNLARPRILTLNNSMAEIAIKTNEAIGETAETSASEGIASATTGEAEREETGVFLRVTPQANIETREITMAIEPKVVEARTNDDFPQFKDPEERGSKSVLRVNDGDTIVIGGLLRTDLADVRTRVPVLGRIPVLGAPFRHKDVADTTRELIIFITPHILDEHVPMNFGSRNNEKIVREQSVPSAKNQAVDKELSYIEKNLF